MFSICCIISNLDRTKEEEFFLCLNKEEIIEFFSIFNGYFQIDMDTNELDYPKYIKIVMDNEYIDKIKAFFKKYSIYFLFRFIIEKMKKIKEEKIVMLFDIKMTNDITKSQLIDIDNDYKRIENIIKKNVADILKSKKIFRKCYHEIDKAKCSDDMTSAHSISKSSSLRKISENNFLYNFETNFYKFFDDNNNDPSCILQPRTIGVNEASTFYGFCRYHDSILFQDIDKEDVEINEKNAFLLGYRAFIKEYYNKEWSINFQKNFIRDISNIISTPFIEESKSAIIPEYVKKYIINEYGSIDSYIKNVFYNNLLNDNLFFKELEKAAEDCKKMQDRYFQIFINKNYNSIKYLAFTFSNIPDILFSGAAPILYDFDGNGLQNDINNLENITINSICYQNGGAVIFQWFENDKINPKFIDSIIKTYEKEKDNICNIIIQLVFSYIENIFMRISWWDKLKKELKEELSNRNLDNICNKPYKSLIPNGNQYCNWGKVNIIKGF